MSEVSPPPVHYYSEDEIDLYELWLVLKKRKSVIFLTTIIFFLFALVYVLRAKPVYKIDFSVKSQFAKPYILQQKINCLDLLIKEKRFEDLKQFLNLPENVGKKIQKIKANIPRKEPNILLVSIEANDRDFLGLIRQKVLFYLAKDKYLSSEKQKLERKLKERISVLKQQIDNLNELKIVAIQKKIPTLDPLEIEKNIIDLKKQLIETKIQLSTLEPIELVAESPPPEKPIKPKKRLILAVSLVSGFFLGVFLAFFVEWLENARKRYEENSSNL